GEELLFSLFGLTSAVYGVLALVVSVRAWQALLLPLLVSGWQSGELLPRVGVLILLLAIAVPLALWLMALVRRLSSLTGAWLSWVGGRARAYRSREALAALRAVPLWSELPQPRLLEVARLMRAEDVARGKEIVR